jgi:iron-sulfur cluster protein
VEAALADPDLQRAMTTAMPHLREKRDRGFDSLDFEGGRQELKRRRMANLDRLPELLEEFQTRLEEVGGQFHHASDAAQARRIIGDICVKAGAGIVTKSKSMATEEIELNPHLERLGMEVVETDLGERMVQLIHSHPSHLIAPAIHITVEQWAQVFESAPDAAAIQAKARASLREKFINASVGISGANIAIAETGTVVIVSNEGNVDLTTTLPPVHIAVFGMDKIVASLDDATAVLRMLPRSGTGQRMSVYVNWITGPSRSADIEQSLTIGAHGPAEMHCVVLDNGREEMRADPIFRDALTCVRCGACSNACPPFMAVSGHQFGHIYNGPIGLVLTPFHHGQKAADLPNSLCTQCNACQEICPVDIPLPRQILEHRRHGSKPLRKKALLSLWSHPGLAAAAMNVGAPVSRVLPVSPVELPARPYRKLAGTGGSGEPVTLFASCLVDRVMPQVGVALERILEAAGHRVEFPKSQWCCGLISANAGSFERGARLNRELVQALGAGQGLVVTPSASCFGAIDAHEWGAGGSALDALGERMRDSTRFVLDLLSRRPDLVQPAGGEPVRVAYHDSCQSLRQLGLKAEPRRVLELAGYAVAELPDIANCCGFGGTFSLEWPQVAGRLAEWKLDALEKTGCTVLASDNPGCLMHIQAAAKQRGLNIRVAHILELVSEKIPSPLRGA